MNEEGAGAPRRLLDPSAVDAVRAYAAQTRAKADRMAAVLEDIAANGLPSVDDCTPWEPLREQALARLSAHREKAA
ncbi:MULTISPECIES: hypothetical protein [unclassified Streptomyces]|uniref:hypothetical protein n=1 Tax=unclassified Streptomyces TaxID=2593676 RepID=UPI002E112E82|nr:MULTISPECIES: hypothetical protein [unclassified Streptomyces]WSR23072.1 hypothetical protein OG573_30700 [Streptomyces sp. NBC_01205]